MAILHLHSWLLVVTWRFCYIVERFLVLLHGIYIRKEILSAKFYPSVTLPTLEKVFLISLIFPLDHMYDHMYDHIYDVYTMHKSIISVVNTMTIMYLCMASAVICLLSNVCLLFITNHASTPSSRWQRQSLYPFVTAS